MEYKYSLVFKKRIYLLIVLLIGLSSYSQKQIEKLNRGVMAERITLKSTILQLPIPLIL